jgi:TonB family protein
MTLWLSNLAAYSVQLAALVAAAVFVTWLLRFRHPRPALAFWRILLAIGLLLPLMQPWRGTSSTFIASTLASTTAATAPDRVDGGVSIAAVILAVLAIGVTLRLAWLALGLIRLRQITLSWGQAAKISARPAGITDLFDDLKERIGANAELRITDDVDSPCTVGVRRAVVLLPRRVLDLPAPVQRAVLAHELIHVRRRDWLSMMVEELICAALWFNPAARVLASHIGLARETVVDQETIAHTGDRRAYAEALLAFSNPGPRLIATTPFIRRRHLAPRIALITQEVPMSRRHTAAAIAVIVTAVLTAGTAATTAFPIATTLAAQKGKIYKPGDGVTLPRVTKESKPVYTPAAMQQKIQGSVWLLVVVTEKGDVGEITVSKSLDKEYGLDDEAVKAARKWKFDPGKKDGKPVPVQVTLELTFTLK